MIWILILGYALCGVAAVHFVATHPDLEIIEGWEEPGEAAFIALLVLVLWPLLLVALGFMATGRFIGKRVLALSERASRQ